MGDIATPASRKGQYFPPPEGAQASGLPATSLLAASAAHAGSSTRSISNFRSNRYLKDQQANERDRNGSTGALPAFDSDFHALSSRGAESRRRGVAQKS
jgi:hypothetical protein